MSNEKKREKDVDSANYSRVLISNGRKVIPPPPKAQVIIKPSQTKSGRGKSK